MCIFSEYATVQCSTLNITIPKFLCMTKLYILQTYCMVEYIKYISHRTPKFRVMVSILYRDSTRLSLNVTLLKPHISNLFIMILLLYQMIPKYHWILIMTWLPISPNMLFLYAETYMYWLKLWAYISTVSLIWQGGHFCLP